MLLAKRKMTGEHITAYLALQRHGPFVCPDCNEEVILKMGRTTVNHFAHVNPIACKFATGESDEHRRCKLEIFQALQATPGIRNVELERPIGMNRADVSAEIGGVPVAIEVQLSALSLETIQERTIEYHREGVYVLWLLQWTPALDSSRYTPTLWEKWIHALNFGHAYYWREGLTVSSYSFEPHLKTVPKRSWFTSEGKKVIVGGYSQRSKRHRTAVQGYTLNIATDFGPKQRYWWRGKDFALPDAKLFIGVARDGVR
jgi:competence CoiA-like predicted nuclease